MPSKAPGLTMAASATPPPGHFGLTRNVVARYAGASHFARNFVRGKLLTDPASPAILRLAAACGGFGEVTDLGCGRGQVGLSLLIAGLATRVTGLDLDPGKIADADRAAAGLPARFAVADLCAATIPVAETILIFDVLLQLPAAAQQALLARMAEAAQRRIVIRAFDPARGWRSGLASAWSGWAAASAAMARPSGPCRLPNLLRRWRPLASISRSRPAGAGRLCPM